MIPTALARALRIVPRESIRAVAVLSSLGNRARSRGDSGIVRGPVSRRRPQNHLRGATPPDDAPLKKARFKIAATSTPAPGSPPQTLLGFYWHFIRQTKRWYVGMFVASLCVALLDTVIP